MQFKNHGRSSACLARGPTQKLFKISESSARSTSAIETLLHVSGMNKERTSQRLTLKENSSLPLPKVSIHRRSINFDILKKVLVSEPDVPSSDPDSSLFLKRGSRIVMMRAQSRRENKPISRPDKAGPDAAAFLKNTHKLKEKLRLFKGQLVVHRQFPQKSRRRLAPIEHHEKVKLPSETFKLACKVVQGYLLAEDLRKAVSFAGQYSVISVKAEQS